VEIIKSIRYVDEVRVQRKILAIEEIRKAKPDIITIGDDWKGIYVKGLEWFKNHGGEVVYLKYTKDVSTSEVKKQIIKDSYNILEGCLLRELLAKKDDR
jgi:glycerol-3-phosphate cytidylyltransferase-like family protein